jgi:predicted nucleic acid-binding protein
VAQGLILVADSSAWIATLRPKDSLAKIQMLEAINNHTILIPDLVLVEVLRGARTESDAAAIVSEFANLQSVDVAGKRMALKSAAHYRLLRSKGITVRGTVDLLIATWCIENDVPLLHADRDFAGFEEHLGLKRWPIASAGPD